MLPSTIAPLAPHGSKTDLVASVPSFATWIVNRYAKTTLPVFVYSEGVYEHPRLGKYQITQNHRAITITLFGATEDEASPNQPWEVLKAEFSAWVRSAWPSVLPTEHGLVFKFVLTYR